mmetsp:Transcript_63940/g.170562  ORF Transcript_63940/g.170562 Transcript_63940/m.170562 type:complete len:428 (-) Transcript_63940:805-2088(-)
MGGGQLVDAQELRLVVGVVGLDCEEVVEERLDDHKGVVEERDLEAAAEGVERLGLALEGGGVVEGGRKLVEGGKHLRAEALDGALGLERSELVTCALRQLRAYSRHEVGPLVEHDLGQEEDVGEALNDLLLVVDEAVEHRVDARAQVGDLLVHRARGEFQLRRRREVLNGVGEGHRLDDTRGVVEGERRQLLARADEGARDLGEVDDARLRRVEQKEHLHHLDLGVGLVGLQMGAVLDDVLRQLARVGRGQDGRVLLVLQEHDLVLERHADLVAGLLLVAEGVRLASEGGDEGAVGARLELSLGEAAVGGDGVEVVGVAEDLGGELLHRADELDLGLDERGEVGERRARLAANVVLEQPRLGRPDADVGLEQRAADGDVGGGGRLQLHLLLDEDVEPLRVDLVVDKVLHADELLHVGDVGVDLANHA